MKIIAIESSCDETAAAVVEDGQRILSNVISSQVDIHARYGGVVPEVAARSHIEVIIPVIEQALRESDCKWNDIDVIAVTRGPGLIGSLLIGSLTARVLTDTLGKPLVGVNHIVAHAFASFLETSSSDKNSSPEAKPIFAKSDAIPGSNEARSESYHAVREARSEAADAVVRRLLDDHKPTANQPRMASLSSDQGSSEARREVYESVQRASTGATDAETNQDSRPSQPEFPMLALTVSGGHTALTLYQDDLSFEVLGETLDDAAGEAFDKVSKLLGLPYPGGPAISKAAEKGDPKAYKFPVAKLGRQSLDFSFSGLKTAVLRQVQQIAGVNPGDISHQKTYQLDDKTVADIAASFEHNVVSTLIQKTELAREKYQPASVVVGGGVAANKHLRTKMLEAVPEAIFVPPVLCTDNAAMIGALAYQMWRKKLVTKPEALIADSSLEVL